MGSSLPPAEHLLNLLNVCYREDSVSQLLTRTLPQANSPGTAIPEFSHALDRLTESAGSLSSPFFSSVVYSASQRIELGRGVEGVGSEGGREPLPDKDLEMVLRVRVSVFSSVSQGSLTLAIDLISLRNCDLLIS